MFNIMFIFGLIFKNVIILYGQDVINENYFPKMKTSEKFH